MDSLPGNDRWLDAVENARYPKWARTPASRRNFRWLVRKIAYQAISEQTGPAEGHNGTIEEDEGEDERATPTMERMEHPENNEGKEDAE